MSMSEQLHHILYMVGFVQVDTICYEQNRNYNSSYIKMTVKKCCACCVSTHSARLMQRDDEK